MRKIVLLFLILSAILLAAPVVAQETPLSLSIRQTFVQCQASRWVGTKTAPVKGADEKVQLMCGGLWKSVDQSRRHPTDMDSQPSPFYLLLPGEKPRELPFSTWYAAIEEQLKISEEPK